MESHDCFSHDHSPRTSSPDPCADEPLAAALAILMHPQLPAYLLGVYRAKTSRQGCGADHSLTCQHAALVFPPKGKCLTEMDAMRRMSLVYKTIMMPTSSHQHWSGLQQQQQQDQKSQEQPRELSSLLLHYSSHSLLISSSSTSPSSSRSTSSTSTSPPHLHHHQNYPTIVKTILQSRCTLSVPSPRPRPSWP